MGIHSLYIHAFCASHDDLVNGSAPEAMLEVCIGQHLRKLTEVTTVSKQRQQLPAEDAGTYHTLEMTALFSDAVRTHEL